MAVSIRRFAARWHRGLKYVREPPFRPFAARAQRTVENILTTLPLRSNRKAPLSRARD